MPDSNLLVDFNSEDEAQQGKTEIRHFHVLDEDLNLSLFNFDFKESKKDNYKAKMLDCNKQGSGDMW